jgi:uncharacterized protein YndB with AHSA1/START domain
VSESSLTPIKLKVQLPMPAGALWLMWVDPERIVTWLCGQAKIEPKVGGAYELFWDETPEHNSTLGCRITTFEPYQHHLAFTWRGVEAWESLMPAGSTTVTIRLTDQGTSSTLYLTHTGWGEGDDWAEAREWQADAWKHALGGLKAFAEMAQAIATGQQP